MSDVIDLSIALDDICQVYSACHLHESPRTPREEFQSDSPRVVLLNGYFFRIIQRYDAICVPLTADLCNLHGTAGWIRRQYGDISQDLDSNPSVTTVLRQTPIGLSTLIYHCVFKQDLVGQVDLKTFTKTLETLSTYIQEDQIQSLLLPDLSIEFPNLSFSLIMGALHRFICPYCENVCMIVSDEQQTAKASKSFSQ